MSNTIRYITIDGGTTNTRLRLIEDREVKDAVKLDIGARLSIGNRERLVSEVKKALDTLLARNNITVDGIKAILAAGMITSESGLYPVDHITAPAGICELKRAIKPVVLQDICEKPIYFIPGVKVMGETLEDTDIMRGEEVELVGISKLLGDSRSACYVLPGSHAKMVETDEKGRIKHFATTLSGEMIGALVNGTILVSSVDLKLTDFDEDMLYEGYSYCDKHSLNEALFKVRILKNVFTKTERQVYGFFLGAVLHGDVKAILHTDAENVIIGGKAQLKNALSKLTRKFGTKRVTVLTDEQVELSNSIGMIEIFEYEV